MAEKASSRQFLTTVLLVAISICILLVLVHQSTQLASVLVADATPTGVGAYSSDTRSFIEPEMEDVLPTMTPTSMDVSHQE